MVLLENASLYHRDFGDGDDEPFTLTLYVRFYSIEKKKRYH
jgi:hypothetical protein